MTTANDKQRAHKQRAQFVAMAMARRASFRASGQSVSFDAMKAYALAIARGEQLSPHQNLGRGWFGPRWPS